MSIRQGSNYIAGGGSQVNVDNLTINKNASNEIQAISLINQNDQNANIKLWLGSEEDYEAVETKDENTVYFTKDGVIDISGEGSGGLEIGDIGIAPFGIDESLNKRRYLNGQVISQSQFVSFTNRIKAVIQLNPNLAATEENWQAEVTNSKLGQCGKFVIDDDAGTIRLPKVVNINGLSDLALMGSIKAESLPNITGTVTQGNGYSVSWNSTLNDNGGALYGLNATTMCANAAGISSTYSNGFGLDASRSSDTYQDDAPVQQEAVQYPYFIQVATGTEESVDVTREIELNNPFSLLDYKWSEYEISNTSWLISNGAFHSGATYSSVYNLLLEIYNGTVTKEGVSVKLSTEEYTDTDFVLNTADTTFRLPVKVKLASGNAVAGNGMTLGLTDGTNLSGLHQGRDSETNTGSLITSFTGVYGSDVGTAASGSSTDIINKSMGITTDPQYSGIETSSNGLKLYFYVGETIQDANVIAASQVLTTVANCVKKSSATDRKAVISWGMPDYNAGLSVSNPYTAEFPCLIVGQGGTNVGVKLKVNGNYIISAYVGANAGDSYGYGFVDVGDTVEGHNYAGSSSTISLKAYPLKGVN